MRNQHGREATKTSSVTAGLESGDDKKQAIHQRNKSQRKLCLTKPGWCSHIKSYLRDGFSNSPITKRFYLILFFIAYLFRMFKSLSLVSMLVRNWPRKWDSLQKYIILQLYLPLFCFTRLIQRVVLLFLIIFMLIIDNWHLLNTSNIGRKTQISVLLHTIRSSLTFSLKTDLNFLKLNLYTQYISFWTALVRHIYLDSFRS